MNEEQEQMQNRAIHDQITKINQEIQKSRDGVQNFKEIPV